MRSSLPHGPRGIDPSPVDRAIRRANRAHQPGAGHVRRCGRSGQQHPHAPGSGRWVHSYLLLSPSRERAFSVSRLKPLGHAHGHSHGSQPDPVAHDHNQDRAGHSHPVDGHASVPASRDHHQHAGHAHTRVQAKPPRFHNVNILGVLIHIMGDALNSIAVSESYTPCALRVLPPPPLLRFLPPSSALLNFLALDLFSSFRDAV